MHKQTGFTLIEIMLVIAIIGILSAIALPAYQTFVAKAQIAEAIVLLDAAKANSEDEASINGEFPQTIIDLTTINTSITGQYGIITGTANTLPNQAFGDIIYQFSTGNINNNLKNKSVWYTRTAAGKWSCKTDLSTKFTPVICTPDQIAPTGS